MCVSFVSFFVLNPLPSPAEGLTEPALQIKASKQDAISTARVQGGVPRSRQTNKEGDFKPERKERLQHPTLVRSQSLDS